MQTKYRIILTALIILSLITITFGCAPAKPVTPLPTPPPSLAQFEVVSVDIKPVEAVVGETVSIAAVVKNIGDSKGIYAAILTVGGVTVETKEVAITPGSSKVITFSLVKDAPGTYEIGVGELRSSLTVKVKPTVEELAYKIHERVWAGIVARAKAGEYYKCAMYASRILAVKHPEIYLQGDNIFVEALTTMPGFKEAYEIKDVHSDYFNKPQTKGDSFSFDQVDFSKYRLISSKEVYPEDYPSLSFLDRRLAPIATSLKTYNDEVTQLEKAEQLYFEAKEEGAIDLCLIYCDNENAYLYQDGSLVSAKGQQKVGHIEGNPILIFNEESVWYPLMERDDTGKSQLLNKVVMEYSTQKKEPDIPDFERKLADELMQATEVETKEDSAFFKLICIHASVNMPLFMSREIKQEFEELDVPLVPPFRALNETANLISPISAYLAAITKQKPGRGGIEALCNEYFSHTSTPGWEIPYGCTWRAWMICGGAEYSYRTRAGRCIIHCANIGAALELARVDRYRMSGMASLDGKKVIAGHTFIYVPKYDLIISNGVIKNLSGIVVDCYKGMTLPYKYLQFIEHRGKWGKIEEDYFGTLPPDEFSEILTYLRGIHGEDIQSSKYIHGRLIPVPLDELKNQQTKWKPYKLPALAASTDYLGPDARKLYTFKEIVPLLDTPDKVSIFMENNIKWDGRYDIETAGGNEYVPAWVVYERGIDDCDGHATIQAYFLKVNGYEAWNVGIGIGGPEGHGVSAYLDNGLYWILDNCGVKRGPFKSLDELADSVIRRLSIPQTSIILFDPFDITSRITGDPLQLPHTVYRS